MRKFLLLTTASVFLVQQATAAAITFVENTADYTPTTLPASSSNPSPTSSTSTSILTGQVPGVNRSPFENANPGGGAVLLSDGGYGLGAWASLPYTSIQAGGYAIFNFDPSNELTILWGSPDAYNTLSFFTGLNGSGVDLGDVIGTDLAIQTFGHDLVDFSVSGATFSSVRMTSPLNAFEFANLNASVVTPLPATLPLLASGLAGIVALARRKRKTA
jgi:hypothetical protein